MNSNRRLTTCAALALLSVGCGMTEPLREATPPGTQTSPPAPPPPTPAPAPVSHDTCPTGGTVNFTVTGSGLEQYEGRTVMAAAFEPDLGQKNLAVRPLLMATTVTHGSFAFSCPGALHDNSSYPSWAVFLDADGDGRCTTADLGRQEQLYAWSHAWSPGVGAAVQAAEWQPISAELSGPLGGAGLGFCADYFHE